MGESIQIRTPDVDWREFPDAPGVRYKILRRNENGGLSLLLKFEPGAHYHAHSHPGGEEYFVLAGELDDLGKTWGSGSYIYHPPGSVHRPRSSAGCEVLVLLPEPVQVLGGEST